jgi:hypothetical protein
VVYFLSYNIIFVKVQNIATVLSGTVRAGIGWVDHISPLQMDRGAHEFITKRLFHGWYTAD